MLGPGTVKGFARHWLLVLYLHVYGAVVTRVSAVSLFMRWGLKSEKLYGVAKSIKIELLSEKGIGSSASPLQ